MAVISRLVTVWILATLLRSYSCMEHGVGGPVLTTDSAVACGGGSNYWGGLVAAPLLVFFVVTSAVMHSDDAKLTLHVEDRKNVVEEFLFWDGGYLRYYRGGQQSSPGDRRARYACLLRA